VNELLARAGAWFVAPAAAPARLVAAPAADLVAVVAPAPDLDVVAGGLAAELRRRQRARVALVCSPTPVTSRPAVPAARALARRLAARDLAAAPAGVLCRVALPGGEEGVREAWRAVTAAAGVPAVIALPARDDVWDALLADADQRFLAAARDADEAYVEVALASLCRLGPASRVEPPVGFAARRAAALGLARVHPHAEAVA
jgi:hypothetical protein